MRPVSSFVESATKALQGIADNPAREVRLLLAHVLNRSYEDVYFDDSLCLNPAEGDQFKAFIHRRIQHEPLSKILGRREFWGLSFRVTADTLDPRPDSETLIEGVLKNYPDKSQPLKILDLGTGTGCLLLSLLHEYPNAWGVGVDLSSAAIQVAQDNARDLFCQDRALFVVGNWTEALIGTFDVIVSNPPYIGLQEALPTEVARYDPPMALYAGDDGLASYRLLAHQTPQLMGPHSTLFLEMGRGQKDAVAKIFSPAQPMHFFQDLQRHTRVVAFAVRQKRAD